MSCLKRLERPTRGSAPETGLNPALMHRVAVIGSGTLNSLSHNGRAVTRLAVCGVCQMESCYDAVMVAIVGAVRALVAVIVLGVLIGGFESARDGYRGTVNLGSMVGLAHRMVPHSANFHDANLTMP
jgi:hypothetical protein